MKIFEIIAGRLSREGLLWTILTLILGVFGITLYSIDSAKDLSVEAMDRGYDTDIKVGPVNISTKNRK